MLRNFRKYKLSCVNVRGMSKLCKNIMTDIRKRKKWTLLVISTRTRKTKALQNFQAYLSINTASKEYRIHRSFLKLIS